MSGLSDMALLLPDPGSGPVDYYAAVLGDRVNPRFHSCAFARPRPEPVRDSID
jgi:hypothetical protein